MLEALLAITSLLATATGESPLLVISMDGFRWDYIDQGWDLPTFTSFTSIGASIERGIRPSFITKTFPNHYTLATGLYEEAHGITGNHFLDLTYPPGEDQFSGYSVDPKWYHMAEPIWVTATRQGYRTAVHSWPGGEVTFGGTLPTLHETYRPGALLESLATCATWLNSSDPPALTMLYLEEPDATGHAFSPNSSELKKKVEDLDRALGAMLQTIPRTTNVVLLADHGMATTSESRVIMLSDCVDTRLFRVGDVSPIASIYPKRAEHEGVIFQSLKGCVTKGTVYRREDIPDRFHYKHNRRIAPIIVVADPGWGIKVDSTSEAVCCGDHGYDNNFTSMGALFLAKGPSFVPGASVAGPVENVNVYSLLCTLLHMHCLPSNGTVDPFLPLLDLSVLHPTSPANGEWTPQNEWLPPQGISLTPSDGATLVPGVHFDVSLEVPFATLLPHAALRMSPPLSSLCKEDPLVTNSSTHTVTTWRNCLVPSGSAPDVVTASIGEGIKVSWRVLRLASGRRAKNVILMIGDGMSVPMITATRLLNSSKFHDTLLPTDRMQAVGVARTHSLESIVTDSAAAATALMTGHKTINAALGVYPDSTGTTVTDNPRVETVGEVMKRSGRRVGIVTTASVVDATPAAVYAHCSDRHQEAVLAEQALQFLPDVFLGGGARAFDGSRGRELLTAFGKQGYAVVRNSTELEAAKGSRKIVGMFNSYTMTASVDRGGSAEPSLPSMALAALEGLRSDKGFFLLVEGASIDKYAHACDADRMLGESVEFQETVGRVLDWLQQVGEENETLVVVTSDHGTGGYDVYGTVDTAAMREAVSEEDQLKAIHRYGAAGWVDYRDTDGDGHVDNWHRFIRRRFAGLNNNHPRYREDFELKPRPWWLLNESAIGELKGLGLSATGMSFDRPVESGRYFAAHTATDVLVFASGPGSHFFTRGIDNTEVFHGMLQAIWGHESEDKAPPPALDGTASLVIAVLGAYAVAATVYGVVITMRHRAPRRSLAEPQPGSGYEMQEDAVDETSTFGTLQEV